ncbi:MAG: hypothetical protein JNJ83_00615 [Verrucomicrobiaceae bacterium]|nr:hypothetical protein [Verrucomicrobiaceae bacterium]
MKPLTWDAIDPATGQPYRWDSPNLTWSGILEPGDPGYIPPPNANQKRQTKQKQMKHNSYYPSPAPQQIVWLTNYSNKIGGYTAVLGLEALKVAATIADARWLVYIMGSWQPAAKAWAKACTDAVKEAQFADSGALMVLPVFTPPPLPPADAGAGLPAVVPVNAGALDRIFSFVQVIKQSPGYTEAIASDLGTTGTEAVTPDLNTSRPELTVEVTGPNVFVGWGWQGLSAWLEMLQLQVDRGDGQGFRDLAFDSTPGYLDTAPHPAALTKWKYRGIYRTDDAQVGQWSLPVEVVVGG